MDCLLPALGMVVPIQAGSRDRYVTLGKVCEHSFRHAEIRRQQHALRREMSDIALSFRRFASDRAPCVPPRKRRAQARPTAVRAAYRPRGSFAPTAISAFV